MRNTKQTSKTVSAWKKELEELFINNGLTPKWGHKTGSCILPAPRKQDQNISKTDE